MVMKRLTRTRKLDYAHYGTNPPQTQTPQSCSQVTEDAESLRTQTSEQAPPRSTPCTHKKQLASKNVSFHASVRTLDTQLETLHRSSCPGFRGKAHLGTEMVIGMSYVRRLWSFGRARGRGLLLLKKAERRNLRQCWIQWIAYYDKDWSWTRLSYRWEEHIATTTAAWQERGLELETPAP